MMEIAHSARKHGVADDDMRHAIALAVRVVRRAARSVCWSSAQTGWAPSWRFVVLDPDAEPVIIHAMPLRSRFYRFLEKG
jgi:hypothetical protein